MAPAPDPSPGPPFDAWLGSDAPSVRGGRRPWRSYLLAVVSVAACSLLGKALAGRVDEAHMILVYLAGTLPIALRGDRGAGVFAALLAVAAFDLFFVPPHFTLAVADPQYLLTFVVMGLVGAIVSSLTAELSANVLAARQREREAVAARTVAETERRRSTLLSSVSHDMRTPLAGIMGAASSLVDGAEDLAPETRRELAQGIVEEADRLTRLVTNLLHATRLDAGEVALARTRLPIEEAVAPALSRLADQLGGRRVTLDVPPELPLVYADPVLLELVFANLLENCAKHTPPDATIGVRAWPDGGVLRVEVADDGPGLPAGEEEGVFEKFRRFPRPGAAQGAGLGLAIARGVVEAHGGAIVAANRPTGGAAFRFSVPAAG